MIIKLEIISRINPRYIRRNIKLKYVIKTSLDSGVKKGDI